MPSVPDPLVLSTCDARGVVTLTLNRPQAFNALSEDMLEALQAALDAIAQDERVRVVVLGAAGKAFCAGHDLNRHRGPPAMEGAPATPPGVRVRTGRFEKLRSA